MLKLQTLNPQLSNLGIDGIETALGATTERGTTLREFLDAEIDYVFCSDFMRAIETAMLLFPSRHVNVVPYIGETSKAKLFVKMGWDLENKQENEDTTLARLRGMKYPTTRLHYNLYNSVTGGKNPSPNMQRFFERVVVEHWMNPESPYCLFSEQRTHVRVVVVTHGNVLRSSLPKFANIPNAFWYHEPIFRDRFCTEPYKPTMPAVGNVGMLLSTDLTFPKLHRLLLKKEKLKCPLYLFDTLAAYDPETGQCMKYNHRRFVLPEFGRQAHVRRCDSHIRAIPSLK